MGTAQCTGLETISMRLVGTLCGPTPHPSPQQFGIVVLRLVRTVWTPRGSFGIVAHARRPPSHQNQSCPAKVPGSSPLQLGERHQTQKENNGRAGLSRELELQRELHLVGGLLCPGEISPSLEILCFNFQNSSFK